MKKIVILFLIILFSFPFASSKIIFGIDKNYPPHEFVEDGMVRGFNVDIMKAIAKEMNESMEIKPMVWSDAVKALENGSIDVLCMAENEERRQYFDFSKPILTLKLAIFVREGTTGIEDIHDLSMHSVGVEAGDISEEYLKSHAIHAYIVEADSQNEAMALLAKGEVTAFFGNYYTGIYLIQKHGYKNINVIGKSVEIGDRAIAVRKGNHELLERINSSIDAIMANGVYDEIYQKWYGTKVYVQHGFPSWVVKSIFIFTSFIAAAVAILAVWNRTLTRKIEERTAELREYQNYLEKMVDEKTMETKFLSHRLAHDLKAPLRSIKTFSSLFLDEHGDKISEEGKDMIKRIRDASERMEEILEKLMNYSKVEEREVKKRRLNMNLLVKEVINEMEDEITKRNADIMVEKLPYIHADHEIMKEVIYNLIHNAIKFVPSDRKPMVKIDGEKKEGNVRIYVRDNGIGIPEEKKEEIFSLFTRLHGREEYEGTGIGLAIVKKGVEKMGGRVGIKSKEGEGSTFWIELPE